MLNKETSEFFETEHSSFYKLTQELNVKLLGFFEGLKEKENDENTLERATIHIGVDSKLGEHLSQDLQNNPLLTYVLRDSVTKGIKDNFENLPVVKLASDNVSLPFDVTNPFNALLAKSSGEHGIGLLFKTSVSSLGFGSNYYYLKDQNSFKDTADLRNATPVSESEAEMEIFMNNKNTSIIALVAQLEKSLRKYSKNETFNSATNTPLPSGNDDDLNEPVEESAAKSEFSVSQAPPPPPAPVGFWSSIFKPRQQTQSAPEATTESPVWTKKAPTALYPVSSRVAHKNVVKRKSTPRNKRSVTNRRSYRKSAPKKSHKKSPKKSNKKKSVKKSRKRSAKKTSRKVRR